MSESPIVVDSGLTAAEAAAGRAFLEALAASDFEAMEATMAADATLRALIPPGLREAPNATLTTDYFRSWFGPTRVEKDQPSTGKPYPFLATTSLKLVSGSARPGGGARLGLEWKLELVNEMGERHCSQSAFCTLDESTGKIVKLDLVCGGINKPYDRASS